MIRGRTQRILAIVSILMLGFASAQGAVAQVNDPEGMLFGANTAYCPPDAQWPFQGCTPWEGVTVTFSSSDGTFNESCVTAAGDRTASCTVNVPYGSTITSTIDPAIVPDGYVLEDEASQVFEIPETDPDGVFGGPVFVLLEQQEDTDAVGPVAEEPAGEQPVPDIGADNNTDDVVTLPETGSGTAAESGVNTATALLLGGAALCSASAYRIRQAMR